jgi:hypothetical protein
VSIESAARTAARTTTAAESDRVAALVEIGIDSPLKLDLVAALAQDPWPYEGAAALATSCGASLRDVLPTLEQLERAKLVECRRLYNITEYGSSRSEAVRDRLASLLGATPAEVRRLRRALLARAHARIS